MYTSSITGLQTACLHHVGRPTFDEGFTLSNSLVELDAESIRNLMVYGLSSFKNKELMRFHNVIDLDCNEVYKCVKSIFDEPDTMLVNSQNLARYLYLKSTHPNIKAGDFLVVYYNDCEIDGVLTDAVGIYKSENLSDFLSMECSDSGSYVRSHRGVSLTHVDKAALIFNTNVDDGFSIAVIDNATNKSDAKYWVEDFLGAVPQQDRYFQTRNFMSVCKNFVTKQLPEEFDISKADQVELLNRSVQYFKSNDEFSLNEFVETVLEQPDVIKSFNSYKEKYQQERDIDIEDNFSISEDAVKKQSRSFKSVIKLDKNFHIYVHGNRNLIEQGEDEKGRFYKVYFKEEY